jgi:uncharacterized protein (TIGR02266 family)
MRTPITLKIKFKSSSLEQFIERYSVDVSRGGIFIRTKEPLPVGTQLRFEFQLQDASSLIAGDGTVVWIRENDPARASVAPGMGVRFDKLATDSQKVLDRILSEKQKRGSAQMESRFDAGVRQSATASGSLTAATPPRAPAHNDFGGGDSKAQTPIPKAMPGLDIGDEFSNESTRVMQNELVQSLADRTRDDPRNAFSEDERTRKASREELNLAVNKSATSGQAKVEVAPLSEAKPEPKIEAKPEPKIEAKVEVKPELKAAPKSEEPKPLEKKPEAKVEAKPEPPKVVTPVAKQPAKEPARPVAATIEPPRVMEPRAKRGQPIWLWVVAALTCAAAGVGYTVFRKSPATPPVVSAEPTAAKPTENPPAVAEKQPAAAPAPEEAKPEPAVAAGLSVPVTSDPPGATVTVDGKPLPSPTPTTLTGLDDQKVYDVRVALKGFHEWKINLKPHASDKLDAALVPNEKLIEVATTPPGADVTFDGKKVGRSPMTIHKLDVSKPHQLEVKRAGYVAQTRSISAADAFEPKGDKDVLAIALTLEAAPVADKPKAVAKKVKKAVGGAPEGGEGDKSPAEKPAAVAGESSGDKAAEKPVAEKPAAPEKPAAEKPAQAEKPAAPEKAAASEKPASDKPASDIKPAGEKSDKSAIKTPSWMKSKPAEGNDPPPADKPQ